MNAQDPTLRNVTRTRFSAGMKYFAEALRAHCTAASYSTSFLTVRVIYGNPLKILKHDLLIHGLCEEIALQACTRRKSASTWQRC